uniref:Exonuclease domain-containing protein n=1 Tax=Sphenodon punctatus TaxID=8508 RepID=A0A8D0H279_SPHPU
MAGQFLQCSHSSQELCCLPSKTHLTLRADAEAQSRSKKKSPKHQRFMARRALLEQRGLLRPREKCKIQPVASHVFEVTLAPAPLPREASKCGQPASKTVSAVTSQSARKAHRKISKLKQCVLAPPEGIVQQSSPPDVESRLSLPGIPTSGRASPSCLLLRPEKCVAIDCEMVGTGPGRKVSELARCTVVNYDGDVIYDKYIRPELPITDYRTRWSGITPRHMQKATPFRTAQREILQILKDKIVVGHALYNDFRVLNYFHPKSRTRDTSQTPLLKQKAGLPVKISASLKSLAMQLLHKRIQVSKKGHSSVEDAQTAMELYRLVEVQWEQELASILPSSPPSNPPDSGTDSDHYMDDRYWPEDLNVDCK